MTARAWGMFLLAALGAGLAGVLWLNCEGTPPDITAPEGVVVGRAERILEVVVADEGTGLRTAEAKLVHAGGEEMLLTRRWTGGPVPFAARRPQREALTLPLDVGKLGVSEGAAVLELAVSDGSWRRGLRGNQATQRIPVTVDLSPPRVALESGLTYVRHGGSGALAYAVSEPSPRDGVEVGDRLFAGFPHPRAAEAGRRRVALFAVPVEDVPEPPVRVVAVDEAGNRGVARPAVRIQGQVFPEAPIQLSPGFLSGKVAQLARAEGIDAADPVEAFRSINSELRAQNEARVREIVSETAPEPLFEGAFVQLANSKVTSRFAERRAYFVEGRRVSEATHYGFDLASTAGAPVPAANSGRVRFAGDLGIYGGCVILDHGLGLASLYGHLSQIDVAVGASVAKGDLLGRSGQTGLAGGDHLHFAILLGGVYVDPMEWWDPKWVREHVQVRLDATQP